jgi:hypothetical protein
LLGYTALTAASILIFLNSNPQANANKGSISANLIIVVPEGELAKSWC